MKIITKKSIVENYKMSEIVDAVERIYKLLGEGKAEAHERHFIKTKDGGDYMYAAATDLEKEWYVVRGSSYMPWNKDAGKSAYAGCYILASYDSGEQLAVVDSSLIVSLRTGAKSAVAAKYLAKKDTRTLGLIGLGTQALFQAEAITSQFKIEKIVGYCRKPEERKTVLENIKLKTGIEVQLKNKEEIIKEADILVVATTSDKPLLSFDNLHEGQLVISLAHKEEIDKDVVKRAKTYVDYKPEAIQTFGPVKAAIESGYSINEVKGDLAEVVSGNVIGRESDEEIIYFQSLGVTIEDLAVVENLYEKLQAGAKEASLET